MLECSKCKRNHFHYVCPIQWPIDTIALVCSTCGRVGGYADNLLLIGAKDATVSFTRREFASTNRRTRKVEEPIGSERMILMGLRNGLDIWDIAETLGVAPEVVTRVADINRIHG